MSLSEIFFKKYTVLGHEAENRTSFRDTVDIWTAQIQFNYNLTNPFRTAHRTVHQKRWL